MAQFLNELPRRAVPAAFVGGRAAQIPRYFGHIGDVFRRLKQGLQVAHQLVGQGPHSAGMASSAIQPVGQRPRQSLRPAGTRR